MRSPTLGDQELILSSSDTTHLLPESTVAGERLVHMAPLQVAATTGKQADRHQTVVSSAGPGSSSSPEDILPEREKEKQLKGHLFCTVRQGSRGRDLCLVYF